MHIRVDLILSRRLLSSFFVQAKIALSKGEVPVGCVIVHGPTGRIVSCGHNETNEAFNVRNISYVLIQCPMPYHCRFLHAS